MPWEIVRNFVNIEVFNQKWIWSNSLFNNLMLSLNSISIGLQLLVHVYAYLIKDIVENTGMTPTDSKLDNNTPYTSTTFCTESHVGPYLGLLDSNIKRSFTNVRPHYSITLSLDIYYTEYWGALGNYFKIMFDGT